jgi:2-polyprenyl-3-methyl-5-hydroxy-6-metoxy-1,4-benzoquinol methylase
MQTDAPRERAAGRLGLISGLLIDALASLGDPASVLDCGGGSGAYAVPLAAAGADVTVVDISADALATLARRAAESGVAERVHPLAGDVEALDAVVGPRRFDLAMAHGILESVDDAQAAFTSIVDTLRPGGLLSVLVSNPVASVIGRALAGEPALALLELQELDSGHRLSPERVVQLCLAAGLTVTARHGVGVFSDLVPGAALDAPGARAAVAHLDAEAAGRPPFADIAGRVHLLARRPG